MDNFISRKELDATIKRLDAENDRQNHRLSALEETMKQLHALTSAVEKLAFGVQNMVEEQKKQSQRLETLEKRDGEMWRKLIGYALTGLVAFIFAKIS